MKNVPAGATAGGLPDRVRSPAHETVRPLCPMERLAGFILTASTIVEGMDDAVADEAFKETLQPLYRMLWQETPRTRSLAGAVAALRLMVLIDDMEEGDLRVARSVLAFLETLAPIGSLEMSPVGDNPPPLAIPDDQAA